MANTKPVNFRLDATDARTLSQALDEMSRSHPAGEVASRAARIRNYIDTVIKAGG